MTDMTKASSVIRSTAVQTFVDTVGLLLMGSLSSAVLIIYLFAGHRMAAPLAVVVLECFAVSVVCLYGRRRTASSDDGPH